MAVEIPATKMIPLAIIILPFVLAISIYFGCATCGGTGNAPIFNCCFGFLNNLTKIAIKINPTILNTLVSIIMII